jgi:multiple sugar transport system substrate-binding protein
VQDGIPKTVARLDSGTPPDVAYIDVYDFQVMGKWAFEASWRTSRDVIAPIKDTFLPNTRRDDVPVQRQGQEARVLRLPAQAADDAHRVLEGHAGGGGRHQHPDTWKEYWAFWCDKAQPDYRKKTGKRIFGTGFPMGVDSSDSLLLVPDVHGRVQRQARRRRRQGDGQRSEGPRGPDQRAARLHDAVHKGCTPPSATSWKDPDNNVAFHNKTTIMTHNATISIAAKWFDDMNNDKLKPREREQAKKNYNENIATSASRRSPTDRR